MKFTGKTIIITGASSGIGKRLKEYFGKENTVVSLSRSAVYPDIPCDLSDDESINAAAEEIKTRFGKVDVLINNAGYGLYGAAELLGDEQIEKQFSTNLTGRNPFYQTLASHDVRRLENSKRFQCLRAFSASVPHHVLFVQSRACHVQPRT